MRKGLVVILISVFLLGACSVAMTKLQEKNAELEKVRGYIALLDQKIVAARQEKQINKLAELKDLKRSELERSAQLNEEIAQLKAQDTPEVATERFQAELGYGGGAAVVGLGYVLPLKTKFDVLLGAGYGIGNQYSVLIGKILAVKSFANDNFAGINLGVANYSEAVSGIPGIAGNITKGSRFGFGLVVGRQIKKVKVLLGYDTALGVTAGVTYRF